MLQTKKVDAPAANGKDTEMKDADGEVYKTDAEIEAERAASLLAAKKDILSAVNATLLADSGACQTGLYELRGLITHQGASADSGHYISYVKKMPRMKKDEKTGKLMAEKRSAQQMEGDALNGWWKFDDEKVSECGEERIKQLAGGGESASALVCLYAAVPLPELTEEEEKA